MVQDTTITPSTMGRFIIGIRKGTPKTVLTGFSRGTVYMMTMLLKIPDEDAMRVLRHIIDGNKDITVVGHCTPMESIYEAGCDDMTSAMLTVLQHINELSTRMTRYHKPASHIEYLHAAPIPSGLYIEPGSIDVEFADTTQGDTPNFTPSVTIGSTPYPATNSTTNLAINSATNSTPIRDVFGLSRVPVRIARLAVDNISRLSIITDVREIIKLYESASSVDTKISTKASTHWISSLPTKLLYFLDGTLHIIQVTYDIPKICQLLRTDRAITSTTSQTQNPPGGK